MFGFEEDEGLTGIYADVMTQMATHQSLHHTLERNEQREKDAYLNLANPVWTFPEDVYITFLDQVYCYRDIDMPLLFSASPYISGHVVELWGRKFWLNTPAQLMVAVHQAIHGIVPNE